MSSHKDHRMIEFTQGANRGTICGEVRSCRRLVSPSSFPPARDTRRDIRTIITGFKWNRDRSNLLPMYQRPPIDYEISISTPESFKHHQTRSTYHLSISVAYNNPSINSYHSFLFHQCLFVYSDPLTPYSHASPRSSLKPGFRSISSGLLKRFLDVTLQSSMESCAGSSLPDIIFATTPRKHDEEPSTMKQSGSFKPTLM